MQLFSYHNGIPAPLPLSLQDASLDALKLLGYSGPFPAPVFDARSQEARWNGSEWLIVSLSQDELKQRERNRLLARANWMGFSSALMNSSVYKEARALAATNLDANVDCMLLISSLADARAGNADIGAINKHLANIGAKITLTEEDKIELYRAAQANGLSELLALAKPVSMDEHSKMMNA